MAGRAMPEPLDKVGAAVPGVAPVRIGLEAPGVVVEKLPSAEERPEVRRERQVVRWWSRGDSLLRHQERVDRGDVLVPDLGDVRVGKAG